MKKSDFTIDKRLTTLEAAPLVKQAIADFCAAYTDGDVLREIIELGAARGAAIDYGVDVLSIKGEAFRSSFSEHTNFQLEAILVGWRNVWKVRVYCDENFTFNADIFDGERFESVERFN